MKNSIMNNCLDYLEHGYRHDVVHALERWRDALEQIGEIGDETERMAAVMLLERVNTTLEKVMKSEIPNSANLSTWFVPRGE